MTKALKRFLTDPIGSGWGYGSGYGSGSGWGWGYGSGEGDGWDEGSGWGYGWGSGEGDGRKEGSGSGSGWEEGSDDGSGLITFAGHIVHYIDEVATVIERVRGNLAKGFIVNKDLTTSPCYVAKLEWLFAHGETVKDAEAALQSKLFAIMDPEEKIEAFLEEFKLGVKYPAMRFYEWHNKLTGSCEMGRKSFARDHGIDLENGLYTVEEFVEITRHAYGGEIIEKLKERIEEET